MKNILRRFGVMINKRTSEQKAIQWIKDHRIPGSGIVVQHKTKTVTPEVTGYIIDTLYRAGEEELAFDLARWEIGIQKKDGSFSAPGVDISYTFDTAQVIRGFLTVSDSLPQVKPALLRACDYMLTQIGQSGEIHSPSDDLWSLPSGVKLSRYCNLYCIAPLLESGKKFSLPQYIEAATRSLNFYKDKPDLTEFKSELGTLSHIFGYMMEALAELGEKDLAQKGLDQALGIQRPDGAIPAYPGAEWVCSTGMAQLGLAWFKIGDYAKAEKMLNYLEKIQNPSGGFYGGYGKNVQYFYKQEISWANKFFIDLSLAMRGKINE